MCSGCSSVWEGVLVGCGCDITALYRLHIPPVFIHPLWRNHSGIYPYSCLEGECVLVCECADV